MKTKKHDIVSSPDHYTERPMECIKEMEVAFGLEDTMKFCVMNAWKYRHRAPYKGNPELDQQKSDQYMKMARDIKNRIDEKAVAPWSV